MSDGFPSMTALLGLIAVAGFQNRDKIAEMLGGGSHATASAGSGSVPQTGTSAGGLGGLGGLLGGQSSGGVGGFLNGGLNDLVNKFQQNGHGPVVDSWVNHGPNQDIAPHQVEQAIGPDVLNALIQRTGLSREDLLGRLSQSLPKAVDGYTPDGRLPSAG